jgi:lambda family phage portal protein
VAKFWYDTPLGQARLDEIKAAPAKPTRAPNYNARMYASAKSSRLTADWQASNTSADSELVSSLTKLRSRSRQLVRDASYAKRAKILVVNNVIGWSGIGMQAQVKTNGGALIPRINDDIEEQWDEWCAAENCHTGGRLHFAHFERALQGEMFEAGEVFVRLHFRPFGNSKIPLCLELIEAERLADEFMSPYIAAQSGNQLRMGVEVDEFYRPVAYHIRKHHPSEFRFGGGGPDLIERVPADQIIHLAVVDRWPQTRGEPWLHTAARKFNDMDGYSEAEIVRARAQANNAGAIETSEDAESFGELQADGSVEMEAEAGVYKRLNPGEKFIHAPVTAPNPAFDGFMRNMLREVAAGTGPSYESISRDYSQSNYSSSRMGILDDRDLYRFFQWSFIRDFRQRLHPIWMQQAVLSGAISAISVEQYALQARKFQSVRYKPRGWTWIDPTTEVDAYDKAVKAGFTTVGDVIAKTADGLDIEDVMTSREQELQLMKDKGLVFTTSPEAYDTSGAAAPGDGADANSDPSGDLRSQADAYGVAVRAGVVTPQIEDEELFRTKLGLPSMSASAKEAWERDNGTRRPITLTPPGGEPQPPPAGASEDDPQDPPERRVFSFQRK